MVIYNGPDTYIAGEMPVFYVNATEFLRRDVSFQKMRKSLHEENKEEKEDREEFSLD
jgi:hypothetical protein